MYCLVEAKVSPIDLDSVCSCWDFCFFVGGILSFFFGVFRLGSLCLFQAG